jgi:hypothetical protein
MRRMCEELSLVTKPVVLLQGNVHDDEWKQALALKRMLPSTVQARLDQLVRFGFIRIDVERLAGCVLWLQCIVLRLATRLSQLAPGDDQGAEDCIRGFRVSEQTASPIRSLTAREGALAEPRDARGQFTGPLLDFESFQKAAP